MSIFHKIKCENNVITVLNDDKKRGWRDAAMVTWVFRVTNTLSGVCFIQTKQVKEQNFLILLCATVGHWKANVSHWHVGFSHTHRAVEGCGVVSDFQLIHKHKSPLCLASATLPLSIHPSGQIPVQQWPPQTLHYFHLYFPSPSFSVFSFSRI